VELLIAADCIIGWVMTTFAPWLFLTPAIGMPSKNWAAL
jgi:hypothetical protein